MTSTESGSFFARMRRHPTLVLAVACIALLLGIVATSLVLSASVTSLSLDDVTSEVTSGMDDLQEHLPPSALVSASDTIRTEPCPDGGSGRLVAIEREIVTADAFDLTGWTRELSAKYSATEGWNATLTTVGTTPFVKLTLANRALMLFTLTAGTVEHPQTLVMQATSRCSTTD